MSNLDVKIRKVEAIEPHYNAERLELLVIGQYRSVSQKDIHRVGDLVAYLPEDSVFTDMSIPERLGIHTYLAGSHKNRIKSTKLRGIVSTGICIPINEIQKISDTNVDLDEGQDIQYLLKIEKYEEPIPVQMQGVLRRWPSFLSVYDMENLRKSETLEQFVDDEEIVVTCKLHGTNLSISWGPGLEEDERAFVCSHRRALKEDDKNVYWKAARKYNLIDKLYNMKNFADHFTSPIENIAIFGEVIGVQKGFSYDVPNGEIGFRAFDILVNGRFVDYDLFYEICTKFDIPMVPFIYRGPYSFQKCEELTNGKMDPINPGHIMEGIVIKPVQERVAYRFGRVIAKLINPEYLVSKDRSDTH